MLKFAQAFSPAAMPRLSQLNLRSNDLDQHSAGNLLEVLSGFSSLQTLEVF